MKKTHCDICDCIIYGGNQEFFLGARREDAEHAIFIGGYLIPKNSRGENLDVCEGCMGKFTNSGNLTIWCVSKLTPETFRG